MEDEYLFTLEEIRTALTLGMRIALLILEKSASSTTDEIKCTSDTLFQIIANSFPKEAV